MVSGHTFAVVIVKKGHGAGPEVTATPDKKFIMRAKRSGQGFEAGTAQSCYFAPFFRICSA